MYAFCCPVFVLPFNYLTVYVVQLVSVRTGEERILDIVPGGTELGTQVKTGSRAGRTHSQ